MSILSCVCYLLASHHENSTWTMNAFLDDRGVRTVFFFPEKCLQGLGTSSCSLGSRHSLCESRPRIWSEVPTLPRAGTGKSTMKTQGIPSSIWYHDGVLTARCMDSVSTARQCSQSHCVLSVSRMRRLSFLFLCYLVHNHPKFGNLRHVLCASRHRTPRVMSISSLLLKAVTVLNYFLRDRETSLLEVGVCRIIGDVPGDWTHPLLSASRASTKTLIRHPLRLQRTGFSFLLTLQPSWSAFNG